MSLIAAVMTAGVGAEKSAAYTLPVTKDDVANWLEASMINPKPVMAVLAIGLTPILPTIDVVPVVEIPDCVNTAKLPAVPRLTGKMVELALRSVVPPAVTVAVCITLPVGIATRTNELKNSEIKPKSNKFFGLFMLFHIVRLL